MASQDRNELKLTTLNWVKVETICQPCHGSGQTSDLSSVLDQEQRTFWTRYDCPVCNGVGRVEGVVSIEELARVMTPAIMRHIATAQRTRGGYSEGTFRNRQKFLSEGDENNGAKTTPRTGENIT